jgi:hypothetical protein
MRSAYKILFRKHERKRTLEDLGLGGRIILRLILDNMDSIHLAEGSVQWWFL